MTIGIIISKQYKIDYTMQKRIVKALDDRKQGIENEELVQGL
jgi:Na+/melibiose symporter-like transporter